MQGRIVKGIAGFYYVHIVGAGVFECKAKGIFRKEKIKPLVGDAVEIDPISLEEKTGNVVRIFPRKNELIRPAVANVDQVLVIFAADKPKPNLNLLDRFLVMMESQRVETAICFNKADLAGLEELERLRGIYAASGYKLFFVSAKEGVGIGPLRDALAQKTTAVAGPSGVGKSSLINLLQPEAGMETGEISGKIGRGRHTTRHSQLIHLEGQSYIMDTPGFSSLCLTASGGGQKGAGLGIEEESLKLFFPEFLEYGEECRFQGCSHIHEPGCGVRQALDEGKISPVRYGNYAALYEELKNIRKY